MIMHGMREHQLVSAAELARPAGAKPWRMQDGAEGWVQGGGRLERGEGRRHLSPDEPAITLRIPPPPWCAAPVAGSSSDHNDMRQRLSTPD